MVLSPLEHLLLLLVFHTTRSKRFDIETIRNALKKASDCAEQSSDVEEFKLMLGTEAFQSPDWISDHPELLLQDFSHEESNADAIRPEKHHQRSQALHALRNGK